MISFRQFWVAAIMAVLAALFIWLDISQSGDEVKIVAPAINPEKHHLDHSHFFAEVEKFKSPQQVTKACLKCHENAATEVMKTAHWNWVGKEVHVPGHDGTMKIGKKNLLNNFCIAIEGNWHTCTICHIGYGWKDASFDFTDKSNVDCLICHDWTGTYTKGKAGMPAKNVNLLAVAKGVGYPKRGNCNACHSYGGGGMGVKHGDLDISLDNPEDDDDVHMGKNKFLCIDCHKTKKHDVPGRSISVSVDHENGISCSGCHTEKPHSDKRLNAHTKVACQSCHIPTYANEFPTKMTWDWGKAGDATRKEGHDYLKIKGEFTYESKLIPEYYWFDLTADRYILGDKIDPSKPTIINKPHGSIDNPKAKIWPFKVHRAKQPYDKKFNYLMAPITSGAGGYWHDFDWDKALRLGAKQHGMKYSGEYGFARTDMYWPLSHLVAPKEKALSCRDCHGANSRLNWEALGYDRDPGVEPKLHPTFAVRDEDGELTLKSGKAISTLNTCGACHDAKYINSHNIHFNDKVRVSCIECHFKNGELALDKDALDESGYLKKNWVDIHSPAIENCAKCHGMVHTGDEPLTIPENFVSECNTAKYSLSCLTGTVFSYQRLDSSGLNLKDKKNLDYAWDVHASRMVKCTDCHFTANSPAKANRSGSLALLRRDPRKASSAQHLFRPNHELATAKCGDCHDQDKIHRNFPYKERHLAELDCRSCHLPRLYGPAIKTLDKTVVTASGDPRVEYRGIAGQDPNLGYNRGYRPFLIAADSENGKKQIAPFNLVTQWDWTDKSGVPVSFEILKKLYLDEHGYAADIVSVFDKDGDGTISREELVIDSPKKKELITEKLQKSGVKGPKIIAKVEAYKVQHGVVKASLANIRCEDCHSPNSRLGQDIPLAVVSPHGVVPELPSGIKKATGGTIADENNVLTLKRKVASSGFYLFGTGETDYIDLFGLLALLATIIGVSVHGYLRYAKSKTLSKQDVSVQKAYIYNAYVRTWHWVMALSIIALLITGAEIHFAGSFQLLGFTRAIFVHNFFAVTLFVNSFLALFYHLATGEIKSLIPPKKGLTKAVFAQAKYYSLGIFTGAAHPMKRTPEHSHNALQQITYLGLLNILFPMQIITGILIWGTQRWPDFSDKIDGLKYIGPIHSAGSWLFLCFLLTHVYLTTTGHDVLSLVKAMVSGYDEIELDSKEEKNGN